MNKNILLFTFSAFVLVSTVSCNPITSLSSISNSVDTAYTSTSVDDASSDEATNKGTSSDSQIKILQSALTKDYSNVTVDSKVTMVGTMSDDENGLQEVDVMQHEIDKIVSDKEYLISYDNSSGAKYDTYVKISADKVNVYDELDDGSFSNTKLSLEEWAKTTVSGDLKYSYAYLAYVSPTEYGIGDEAVTVDGDKIFVKDELKQTLGYSILQLDDDEEATIDSIEVVIKDDFFSKVDVKYSYDTKDSDLRCEYVIQFTNIGSTTFDYPNVEESELEISKGPEHIDLANCVALTAEEKEFINSELTKELNNFTCEYFNSMSDGMSIIDEIDYFDGDTFFIDYFSSQYFGAFESVDKYYLSVNDTEAFTLSVGENKTIEKTVLQSEDDVYDVYPYSLTPMDFAYSVKLTADDFVKAPDSNVYCLSSAALEEKGIEISSDSFVVAFEIEFDEKNVLKEMRYILLNDSLSGASYDYISYTYSDIGSTELVLPEAGSSVLVDATEEDINELQAAINQDYSNCSMYDMVTYSECFYVDGKNYSYIIDDETEEYVLVIMSKEGDSYYEYDENGNKTEITAEEYCHYFVTFNVNAIDFNKVKYNTFNDTYYISTEDFDLTSFIPYFDDESFASLVKGVEFVVEDGYLSYVYTEFALDGELVTNTGITIYAIGETTVPEE